MAERRSRTLMEMARCMLKSKDLPSRFWLDAVMCANYVLNRCPIKALKSMTAHEAWNGKIPEIIHMHGFGCLAYVHLPAQQRHKLEAKALKCIFVGYNSESKGYRLYVPSTRKIIVSRDVIFDEYASQPLLSIKQQPLINAPDAFDSLMPLFQSAADHIEPATDHFQPHVGAENQQNQQLNQLTRSELAGGPLKKSVSSCCVGPLGALPLKMDSLYRRISSRKSPRHL